MSCAARSGGTRPYPYRNQARAMAPAGPDDSGAHFVNHVATVRTRVVVAARDRMRDAASGVVWVGRAKGWPSDLVSCQFSGPWCLEPRDRRS